MDNFNIMNEKKSALEPVIEQLYLLCYTKMTFSQIEKDILLQNLREAYMAILSMQPLECLEVKEKEEETLPPEVTLVAESEKEEETLFPEVTLVAESEKEEETLFPEVALVAESEKEEETLFPEVTLVAESEKEEETLPPEVTLVAESEIQNTECEKVEEEIEIAVVVEKVEETITPQQEVKVIESSPLTTPKRSLNDLFTEKKEERSLNARFSNEKIGDLTKSISINDKFLFIRELFQNKGEEFSRSLHILNSCEDIEDAFKKMEEMKKNYYWDSTSSAYLKLCDLIRRKF